MKTRTIPILIMSLLFCATMPARADAQGDASALSTVSALPIASVVVAGSTAASVVVALPLALSVSGAVLVIKTVELSARGAICLLERVSDGASVAVELVAGSVAVGSLAAGTVVTVSVVGAGAILSVAGEAIAFVPNRLGRALMHNERLTN
jgi:hypothetical protein